MNAKKLIAAAVAVVAASGSAFAQGTTEWVQFDDFVSTKTRAEVKAELAQAYASGELARSEFVEFPQVASTTSRAQVQAELGKAYADGALNRTTEWVEFSNVASTRTRAEVREEARQAARPARANGG